MEQGKCFGNMAYAYSQLSDLEMASDYYKHALQAAKDKGNSFFPICQHIVLLSQWWNNLLVYKILMKGVNCMLLLFRI